MKDTIEKIDNYLKMGGLFNPELMEHHKVSDLLLECRDKLENANGEIERLRAALEKIANVKPFYGAEADEMLNISLAALKRRKMKRTR